MINNMPILSMRGVKKVFEATKALKGVDLDVYPNEVHAIVGSNGAGKSTLMKILAGEYIPNGGTVFFNDEDITGLSPKEIQRKGIEVVHQVINIVDSLSILENILLAMPPVKRGLLNWKSGVDEVKDVLELIGIDFDLQKTAGDLSISEQQFVILARAIIRKPKVLILDEPTSRIGLEETEKLFALIGKLKVAGTTTIYISHRMEEIYRICDRISVFRDGLRIETRAANDFPQEELVLMMLGRKLEAFFPKIETRVGKDVLTVKNLTYRNKVNDVSFSVRRGEIVALVGAVGAGKTEIVNTIYGIDHIDEGLIIIDSNNLPRNYTPSMAIQKGIALIPEDRALQGMIGNYNIKNNVTSINMKNITSLNLLNKKKEESIALDINNRLSVVPNDINYTMDALSGGNQQKIVVGKWLTDEYKLYLMDEVASGVDIGAKHTIYELMGELVVRGAGILLSTGDIEEAMGLSDRMLVLYKGKIIKELVPEEVTRDEVLYYIMGGGTHESKVQ